MVGTKRAADGDSDVSMADREPFTAIVKNPWVVLVMALSAGGTGGTLFGRPDSFTGTEAREMKREMTAYVDLRSSQLNRELQNRFNTCQRDIARIERAQERGADK